MGFAIKLERFMRVSLALFVHLPSHGLGHTRMHAVQHGVVCWNQFECIKFVKYFVERALEGVLLIDQLEALAAEGVSTRHKQGLPLCIVESLHADFARQKFF